MTKVFVSYRGDDIDHRDGFRGMMTNNNNPISEAPLEDRAKYDTEDEIRKYLNKKVLDADVLVVLIGEHTHNGPWVNHEINSAKSQGKPIIPVRIPNTTGGLPSSIKDKDIVNWNYKDIQSAFSKSHLWQ